MKVLRELLSLLESTGDEKFDAMMGGIEKKAKAESDFHAKIKDVADSVPDMMKRQRELEKWVAVELVGCAQIPNKMMRAWARELEPLAREYHEGANALEVLYFHMTNSSSGYTHKPENENEEELQQMADEFVEHHKEELQDVFTAWMHAFEQLKTEAGKKDWPTGKGSWTHRDVTRFSYAYSWAKDLERNFKSKLQ
jgi:hypothetical protein